MVKPLGKILGKIRVKDLNGASIPFIHSLVRSRLLSFHFALLVIYKHIQLSIFHSVCLWHFFKVSSLPVSTWLFLMEIANNLCTICSVKLKSSETLNPMTTPICMAYSLLHHCAINDCDFFCQFMGLFPKQSNVSQ